MPRRMCALLAALLLSGCGATSGPTGVATNPGTEATIGGTSASPSTAAAPTVRTVLSPLGLNIRATPSVSGARLGTAAQGVVLTVLGHTDQDGGWYQVRGQTVTGWITADPSLTAAGQFIAYQSSDQGFNALYPQSWTFNATTTGVIFHPLTGPQTIVVRSGARTADFGSQGGAGFVPSGQQVVVVCGVTGDLNEFAHSGPSPSPPAPGTPGALALLAQVRLRLDASHALALDFNYSAPADLDVFSAVYNSMTFPFPQCMQAAPAPSP